MGGGARRWRGNGRKVVGPIGGMEVADQWPGG